MSLTSVRIKEEFEESLKEITKRKQRSKSWVINEALAQYIVKDQESSQKWLDTLEALDDIKNGRVIDGDLVHEWMESWGTDNELDPLKI